MRKSGSLFRIKRRWLVSDASAIPSIPQNLGTLVVDKYLSNTKLRLRRLSYSSGHSEYELWRFNGSFEEDDEKFDLMEVSESEFTALSTLSGTEVRKLLHPFSGGHVHIFEQKVKPIIVFSMEFESKYAAIHFMTPKFVTRELSTYTFEFSGWALSNSAA